MLLEDIVINLMETMWEKDREHHTRQLGHLSTMAAIYQQFDSLLILPMLQFQCEECTGHDLHYSTSRQVNIVTYIGSRLYCSVQMNQQLLCQLKYYFAFILLCICSQHY
jgi:hypothetical protein